MLSIHPGAQSRFDELANEILGKTVPGQLPQRLRTPRPSGGDQRFMETTLSAADIEPNSLVVSMTNFLGETSSKYFDLNGVLYAIEGEAMALFNQLAALLCRNRPLRESLGPRVLGDTLLDWIKARLGDGESRSFTTFLLDQANAALQTRTIVVPLENFQSQSAFDLGAVHFTHLRMTREMFDVVEERRVQHQPDQEADIRSASKRHRRWFQGQTCGFVTREWHPGWAAHSAVSIVDRALSALRLFSPSAFAPGFKSAVGRVGRVHVPGNVSCELVDGLPVNITDDAATGYEQIQWPWSDEDRAIALKVGLSEFDRLLRVDDPTDLEEAVLHAVSLLDESVCCNDLHKRAALALTAAESLLLRSDTEPLQLMLAMRCGYLTQKTVDDRLKVAETIRKAYALRSGYVHHGSTESDAALLSELHCVLLDSVVSVARATTRLKTREELFIALERQFWS